MSAPTSSEVTRMLRRSRAGGEDAAGSTARLVELLYGELRDLAASLMRRERAGHTLQPTAVVNEAYLRLVGASSIAWQDRAHFFGIAARSMRQVLIDHARKHGAERRGGDRQRVTLVEEAAAAPDGYDLVDLDEALERFAALDARAARVAELKVFAGLTTEEIAEVLGVSPRTAAGDWSMARMWLGRELEA